MVKLDIMENIRQDIRKVREGRKNGGRKGERSEGGSANVRMFNTKKFRLGIN